MDQSGDVERPDCEVHPVVALTCGCGAISLWDLRGAEFPPQCDRCDAELLPRWSGKAPNS